MRTELFLILIFFEIVTGLIGFKMGEAFEHKKLKTYLNTGQEAGLPGQGKQMCWYLREVREGECRAEASE